MGKINLNKKGNAVTDTVTVIVIIFVLVLSVFIGRLLSTDLNNEIQASDDVPERAKNITQNLDDRYPAVFDGGIILLFVLLWIVVLVAAYLIPAEPIFYLFGIVIFVAVIISAMALENSYTEILTDATFAGFENEFVMTNFLMSNLTLATIVVGFSAMLVLYGKSRRQ